MSKNASQSKLGIPAAWKAFGLDRIIYKICTEAEWLKVQEKNCFTGSEDDRRDGFIHFSTAAQMRDTAAKHFKNQNNLFLLEIDAPSLGPALKWEKSRGSTLFPHLYDVLQLSSILANHPLPLRPDGGHIFPEGLD